MILKESGQDYSLLFIKRPENERDPFSGHMAFPGGRMELVKVEEAAWNVAQILAIFRAKRLPLVHIQHLSVNPGATFFLPETKGVEIHE